MHDSLEETRVKPKTADESGDSGVSMVTQLVLHTSKSFVAKERHSCVDADSTVSIGSAQIAEQRTIAEVDNQNVVIVSVEQTNEFWFKKERRPKQPISLFATIISLTKCGKRGLAMIKYGRLLAK